ncbi:polymer-forming cytoskeletal protein [Acidovorax sp. BL-A-41-H1]|uniref:polymer-forming cytoskeletal protein n=1 Tax=Acidovorax sp. BL-A-41-H1 TaxID=3421102 RepID=UPI003F79CE3F
MNTALYYLAFTLLSVALLAIAFGPTWREWRHPTDTAALQVLPQYTTDIEHFSDRFRELVKARQTQQPGLPTDEFDFAPVSLEGMNWATIRRPLVCLGSIKPQGAIACSAPVFIHGDFEAQANSRFVGLLARGSIRLGTGCEVGQWAHADASLHLGRGCSGMRRLSSGTSVELAADCCFERIQAPYISFGGMAPPEPEREPTLLIDAIFERLEGAVRQSEHVTLIRGNCKLPRMHRYHGSLVVTGRLLIGAGTEILGDVKARDGIVMGAGARVKGALCSEKQIQILDHAEVAGPLVSESGILLGAGVQVGTPLAITTISAETIMAEAGARAHGTVWARRLGVVWTA